MLIEIVANWYRRCLIKKNAYLAASMQVVYQDCEQQIQ